MRTHPELVSLEVRPQLRNHCAPLGNSSVAPEGPQLLETKPYNPPPFVGEEAAGDF